MNIKKMLALAKKDDFTLLRFSEVWQGAMKEKSPNPVANAMGLKFVRPTLLALSSVCAFILGWGGISWSDVLLLLAVSTICVLIELSFYRFWSPDSWKFCKAIDIMEKAIRSYYATKEIGEFSQDRIWASSEVLKAIAEKHLQSFANDVSCIQRYPWRRSAANEKRHEFEVTHRLLTRLLPQLPKEYDHYFPTPESVNKELAMAS